MFVVIKYLHFLFAVFKLKEVVDAKTTGQELKARVVNLSGEPKSLACSCDGSMLAVNYFHNNTGFLQIFQVDSFVSPVSLTFFLDFDVKDNELNFCFSFV